MSSVGTLGTRIDRSLLSRGLPRWPLLTIRLIEARRWVTSLGAQLGYRRRARSVIAGSQWAGFIPRREGYRLFSPTTFPELPAVVSACEAIFERHRADVAEPAKFRSKPYFFNVMTVDDLAEHPVLMGFALSASVTQAVTGYLGHVPRLHSIGVFYTAVNESVAGSQMYHVDGDCVAQVKCFVNIWPVGAGSGSLTFLPKDRSSAFRDGGILKTVTDEEVFRAVPSAEQVRAEGPAGSGVLVDTSGCLHQGSRARRDARLVFQFQYVKRPDALIHRADGMRAPGGHILVTPELVRRLGVGGPHATPFVS